MEEDRIGGDEFVALLEDEQTEKLEPLIAEFKKHMDDHDNNYDSVFKRADRRMYKNKKAMKAARE